MTCSPTCCPPGACAASPASSNARSPTLGSRRALTATGPSRPSHPPKPSPSDEPDPRQTHNATALRLGLPWITVGCDENHRSCVTVPPLFATAVPQAVSEDLMRDNGGGAMSAMHRTRIRPGGAKDSGAMFVDCIGGQLGLHVLDPTWRRLAQPRAMR